MVNIYSGFDPVHLNTPKLQFAHQLLDDGFILWGGIVRDFLSGDYKVRKDGDIDVALNSYETLPDAFHYMFSSFPGHTEYVSEKKMHGSNKMHVKFEDTRNDFNIDLCYHFIEIIDFDAHAIYMKKEGPGRYQFDFLPQFRKDLHRYDCFIMDTLANIQNRKLTLIDRNISKARFMKIKNLGYTIFDPMNKCIL